MDFDTLLAPLGAEAFMAGYYGRRPVHLPAPEGTPRRSLLDWERLNDLLAIQSHWTEANIDLIMNGQPIDRDHYVEDVLTPTGRMRLAGTRRIEAFLSMGASLVANAVEQIAPDIRRLTDLLADRFSGLAGANIYCSFKDIQAFPSHCDPHEVFAIHCAGEKIWRIYENRAEAPLVAPRGDEAEQRRIDAAKGGTMMEVRMRPGDLLYIPRGFYHDALASSGESLHLTLGVAPHSGRVLFRLLEDAALADPIFREYLPDAREEDGAVLRARLDALAERAAAILRTPAFLADIANAQRKLARPGRMPALPERAPLEAHARTDRPATVKRSAAGAALIAGGQAHALGLLGEEAEWLLSRPAFVVAEFLARYPHRSEAELRALISLVARCGLFVPYQPGV